MYIIVLAGGLAMLLLTRESFSSWVSLFVGELTVEAQVDDAAPDPPSTSPRTPQIGIVEVYPSAFPPAMRAIAHALENARDTNRAPEMDSE
jgi:hypothetical protein